MFRAFISRNHFWKYSLTVGFGVTGAAFTVNYLMKKETHFISNFDKNLLTRNFVSYADPQWVKSWWGNSKCTFDDGIIYDGPYLANLMEGTHVGKLIFPVGHIYEGEFIKGHIPNGKGKLITSNQEVFEGDFKKGAPHGKIKYSCPDGYVYEGDYFEGRKHGKGKYVTSTGVRFEGEFRYGIRHGYGKEISPDGNCYEGEFLRGQPHGLGKHVSADGKIYEGELRDGHFEGKGKLTFPDGAVLEGLFTQGVAYEGNLITSTGDKYHIGTDDSVNKKE